MDGTHQKARKTKKRGNTRTRSPRDPESMVDKQSSSPSGSYGSNMLGCEWAAVRSSGVEVVGGQKDGTQPACKSSGTRS